MNHPARQEEKGGRDQRVHLASWPHWYAPNPYMDLLYGALESRGVRHHPDIPLDAGDLADHRPSIDVLHLHWLYPYWSEGAPNVLRRMLRIVDFGRVVERIQRSGIRVVWTVHNLLPHDGAGPLVRRVYRFVHRSADLRVHHSEWSREAARARYGRYGPSVVVPHGSYERVYASSVPPETTRRKIGVDGSQKLLLCFGQIRHYKGFDLAVRCMEHLDEGSYHLVVAGRPIGSYGERLCAASETSRRITVFGRTLSEKEIGNLMEAADAVLLPYRDLTSSGALLAALSEGCGVIATDHPYFREVLAPEPDAGRFVEGGDARALARGIKAYMRVPSEQRSAAAHRLADRYRWEVAVDPLADWLRREFTPGETGGP